MNALMSRMLARVQRTEVIVSLKLSGAYDLFADALALSNGLDDLKDQPRKIMQSALTELTKPVRERERAIATLIRSARS
jgi:hypothetical protein